MPYENFFVDFKVQCPGSSYTKIEKMQIKIVKMDDGTFFNLPCNGCDSMNGTMPCAECCAAVNKLFFTHPETDTTKVIRLDLNS